jgi:RNA polymerase sigma-70 factor (ECF subfamily)
MKKHLKETIGGFIPISMADAEPPYPAQVSEDANRTFEQLAEPFRREIGLHCYRMLGSLHEAEDLVQETYLRAWRSFSSFDASVAGGSFRAWLYRIATNACLNALEGRKHAQRFLPDQLGPPAEGITMSGPATDVAWLEPYPDSMLGTNLDWIADAAPSPEARYTAREAVQLAFVAAIQQLPPRQRAAIMLCDVLGWSAAEAAALLDGSTASINSALQRGRATLAKGSVESQPPTASRTDAAQQKLLGRYLEAWEGHDVDGFVALLREDATAVMPPWLQWFAGRAAIRSFFAMAWKTCGGLRLIPTAANGQPAFAVYERNAADGRWNANAIHVLTLEGDAISALTLFLEPSLFDAFGLPRTLQDAEGSSALPRS